MGILTKGFFALGKKTNKVENTDESETREGIVSDLVPELSLDMDDDELISLKKGWMKKWDDYKGEVEGKQKQNEEYWLGKQFGTDAKDKNAVDNLIFESLETALPMMTRQKADPMVESDNTEEGIALADKVRKMIAYRADEISYNLKLKSVVRNWSLYLLGVIKVGWSEQENDISARSVRPQKLILDPDAIIEECEYNGYYIGEYLDDKASDLISRFPDKTDYITKKVDGKMGTKIKYISWWTDDYLFWTLDDEVLDAIKNPHWNYPTQEPAPVDEFGLPQVDELGQPKMVEKEGNNHFKKPKKPYVFLSIFNLGKHPHDDTGLVEQNIPLQDLINKRLKQIDVNTDNANGGIAVSGDAFTEAEGQKAARTRRKGGVVWVPTGKINDAIQVLTGEPLQPHIYASLQDYRNELRNIFGTRGSSPQGTINEKTVRGKYFVKGQDADRIGGGISTYLEQFSDHVYNWFVQLMYVYYDEPHSATILGKDKAKEYITLQKSELTSKLLIGVKEGSMVPHDPMDKRNEAIDLWAQKGIDPITFFDRLEFPNPKESAKQLFLWLTDPIQLFPDLAQMRQPQQEQAKPPSESINFKDLPPDGKIQMAAKAGINLQPEGVAQQEVNNAPSSNNSVPLPNDYQQLMTQ